MPALTSNQPILAVAATSSATAAPNGSTDGIYVGPFGRVRTLLAYAGTVNSCTVKIWFRDVGSGGGWYEGASTDDLDALTPGGASAVGEARDWLVGQQSEVFFQVTQIAGGGTVAVRVHGVRE